jgi:hypothetical protein
MLHKHFFSNTTKTNLFDLQIFIYRSIIAKTKSRIQKNEIKQIIKRCKSNNVSESDDISNKILKILCTKLIFSLMNLFRVCVELNYHARCFKIAHIIILKKFNKKNYFDVKTYKFITLLNTLNKILKSINSTHKQFSKDSRHVFRVTDKRSQKQKLRNDVETVHRTDLHSLKHEKKQDNDVFEYECNRRLWSNV